MGTQNLSISVGPVVRIRFQTQMDPVVFSFSQACKRPSCPPEDNCCSTVAQHSHGCSADIFGLTADGETGHDHTSLSLEPRYVVQVNLA
eukprot:s2575_g5.t1